MCPISKYQPNPEIGIRRLNIAIFGCLLLLGGAYLFSMNDVMVSGFKLQELKRQAQTLADENQDLGLRAASLKSYDNLSQRLQALQMVAVDNIDYLNAPNTVAKK
jgi:hypothetical protein